MAQHKGDLMTVGEESNVVLQLNDPRQSLGLTIVLVSIASNGEEAVAIYRQKKMKSPWLSWT